MAKLFVTIDGIKREATEVETAEILKDWAAGEVAKEAESAKAAEKAALLVKLGITDDEAKLLLS